jgi:hypothetical protein
MISLPRAEPEETLGKFIDMHENGPKRVALRHGFLVVADSPWQDTSVLVWLSVFGDRTRDERSILLLRDP